MSAERIMLITHPQVVANLYDFLSSFFFLLWKLMVPNNCLVPIVLQNIFLCVQQKKETHTGLQQLEDFHFWVEYPFKGFFNYTQNLYIYIFWLA